MSLPAQEDQKIFKAAGSMENNDATKAKLIGYGFQVLKNVFNILNILLNVTIDWL